MQIPLRSKSLIEKEMSLSDGANKYWLETLSHNQLWQYTNSICGNDICYPLRPSTFTILLFLHVHVTKLIHFLGLDLISCNKTQLKRAIFVPRSALANSCRLFRLLQSSAKGYIYFASCEVDCFDKVI